MALEHHLPDQDREELSQQDEPRYYDYQPINPNNARFRELLFFGRIAVFSVVAVLTSFILLAVSVRPLLAFPLALLISLVVTSTFYYFILSMRR